MDNDIYSKSIVIVCAKVRPDSLKYWNKNDKTIIKYSLGIIIELTNGIYILTCFHGVRNAHDIIIYKFDIDCKQKYNPTKIISAPELDLALLKINDYSDQN